MVYENCIILHFNTPSRIKEKCAEFLSLINRVLGPSSGNKNFFKVLSLLSLCLYKVCYHHAFKYRALPS